MINNFLGKWTWMGYILGVLIIVPLVVYLINSFRANKTEKYTEEFIKNSISKEFIITTPLDFTSDIYISKLKQNTNSSKVQKYSIFYSHEYKKYYKIITFSDIDVDPENKYLDYNNTRIALLKGLKPPIKIKGVVNRQQDKNKVYGTYDNPAPILKIDIIDYHENKININKKVYEEFVAEYLTFFVSKEELKEFNTITE